GGGSVTAPPEPGPGPYVGARPFWPEDAGRFFGREVEARDLAALLLAHAAVLLYGPSGSGKSSLVDAGVTPALVRDDGFEVLPVARLAAPVGEGDEGNVYARAALLASGGGDSLALALGTGRGPRLVVVDQLEELFTAHAGAVEEREAFLAELSEALDRDPLLRALLVLREEWLAELDDLAELLPEGLRARLRLPR